MLYSCTNVATVGDKGLTRCADVLREEIRCCVVWCQCSVMFVCRQLRRRRTGWRSRVVVWCRMSSQPAGRWRRRHRQWPSGWLCWWLWIGTWLCVSRGGSPTSRHIDAAPALPSASFCWPRSCTTSPDTSSDRFLVRSCTVWIKKIPPGDLTFFFFFYKRLRIYNRFFTHPLNVPIFARLQICIQLSPILTKLCHIKHDYQFT